MGIAYKVVTINNEISNVYMWMINFNLINSIKITEVILLHLFTDCIMKISLLLSELFMDNMTPIFKH